MKHYAKYYLDTGKVFQVMTLPEGSSQPVGSNEGLIEIPERLKTYYVDVSVTPHVLQTKQTFSYTINKTNCIADGTDTVSITGLHNPTTVVWPDGEITEETDGEASFTLDMAGDYTVTLEAIPYLKEVIHVTATDPA